MNARIANIDLAYLLLKYTFSLLESFRCKVLSVLNLKDTFHSLRISKNLKRFCGILICLGSTSYIFQRVPLGLNIFPAISQSYKNTILDYLSSRKYCEAIINGLLLFILSMKIHVANFEHLLKALL